MGFDFNKISSRPITYETEKELQDIMRVFSDFGFKYTESASRILSDYYSEFRLYSHPEELFKGIPVRKKDVNQEILPKIDIATIDKIIKEISKDLKKNKEVNIPNWKKSLKNIIKETEVWLITENDIKNGTTVSVKNRFAFGKNEELKFADLFPSSPPEISKDKVSRIKEIQDKVRGIKKIVDTIMQSSSREEEQNPNLSNRNVPKLVDDLEQKRKELWGEEFFYKSCDWLGCYCPTTGTIILRIERIQKEREALLSFGDFPMDFLMQQVLLHEFIHAALDLWPRDRDGKIIKKAGDWYQVIIRDSWGSMIEFNEETVDNALVLKVYEATDKATYNYIKNAISLQPYYYRNGIAMKDATDYNEGLEYNLASLIQYKISGGVCNLKPVLENDDVTPAISKGEYIFKHKGIGVLAYGVYAMIIKKNRYKLEDVLKTNAVFANERRCLCIVDEREYLMHVEEVKKKGVKRFYTLPLQTADDRKVYISSQWKDFDWPLLNLLIKEYLES